MRTFSVLAVTAIAFAASGCIDREVGNQIICGDLICDIGTENGWCSDCAGLAMIGDGVCEEGDFDFAPECNVEEEEPLSWCGDGVCSTEERGQCWPDCDFGICGDGICSRELAEDPWCRVDCGLAASACGDGVCELGEDIVCWQDCQNGLCGDGECLGAEASWCEHDCDEVCSGDRPVNCGDGCYPQFTDCASDVFDCGGREYRCNNAGGFVNCCHGAFTQCADFAPDCQADETDCDYRSFPCS